MCWAMTSTAAHARQTTTELQRLLVQRDAKIARQSAELKHRDLKITKLEDQLAGLRQHRFGSSSEALDQLKLSLEDEEIEAAVENADQDNKGDAAPATAKDKPKRKPLPDPLPRNEEVLSPGDACGVCGGKLKTLGEDVTEELQYVPRSLCGEPYRAPAHGL